MEHKSIRVSGITGRHSDAIQPCSLSCQFSNLIEEQIPDQLVFLKSSGLKALQIRFVDFQIGREWQNRIDITLL